MSSLRSRLLLAVGLVVVAAIVSLAVFSSYAARVQFDRYEIEIVKGPPGMGGDPATLLAPLEQHYRDFGSFEGVEPILQRMEQARDGKMRAFLADADDVIRPSPPGLRLTRESSGDLRLEEFSQDGRARGRVEMYGPGMPVEMEDSGRIGTLYIVPRARKGPRPSSADTFLRPLNRWLMVGVGVAGLLALLATTWISGRLVRPIEELTRATRKLQQGDLTHRVRADRPDEVGELSRAFNSMAGELERVETLRRGMVSDIAHELRTPLTNARCQLEAIRDGLAEPGPTEIESLHEEVLLLGRLVDDLQELAFAEAGQLRLEFTELSLGDEIRSVVAAAGARIGDGPRIDSRVPDDLPGVRADRERLRQILHNLIDNAIRHTPRAGNVRVEARATGPTVEVAVSDDGAGIAPEHLPHIFERFYRTDPSRDRRTGGAGLGLAITRQLVLAHGGTIDVQSRPGNGTTFTFTLPELVA